MPTLPEIPIDLPSTLLRRRSDVAIAERKMAGVPAAISLSASDGFSQSPLVNLLQVGQQRAQCDPERGR